MDEFLDELLKEAHSNEVLESMDVDERNQLKSDLASRLVDYINKKIIDSLPEDKLQELNGLMDGPDFSEDILRQFIDANVTDQQRVATEAMVEFRQLYLGVE